MAPVTALAAQRSYTLTGFDKVRVEGPYSVTVATGSGTSARASGTNEALERISFTVQSRTLIIRSYASAWGGWPGTNHGPVTVRVTTQQLQSAALSGSGTLSVSTMKAPRVSLSLSGSGSLTVQAINSEQLSVNLAGSGTMAVAGKSLLATVAMNGSGDLSADALSVGDLKFSSRSAGEAKITARRSATVSAAGSGTVRIIGDPACTVTQTGSGTVSCGKP